MVVRVRRVRVQSEAAGVIFLGQRVGQDGSVSEREDHITVRLHRDANGGVKVCEGQRWRVRGSVHRREFVTQSGFRRCESTVDVSRGEAELIRPTGRGILDYMALHPRLNRLGGATADRLWGRFGQSLYEILDRSDSRQLALVLSREVSNKLISVWQDEGLELATQWLARSGIKPEFGRRIVQVHGSETILRVQEDCFRLLSYCAPWTAVDRFASSLGVAPDDPRRLAAACDKVIYDHFAAGHTVVKRARLIREVGRLLASSEEATSDIAAKAITFASQSGRLLLDQAGNGYGIGPVLLEHEVARRIAELSVADHSVEIDEIAVVGACEKRNGLVLGEEQRRAITMVASRGLTVITGGAGSGKTTTLKVICDVLDAQGYEIIQLALAGKAVSRIIAATQRSAQTIASFIHQGREGQATGGQSIDARDRRLAIIVDEASMVDLVSFASLLRSVPQGSKLILTGDPHQLPPIGPGLVLHELMSECVPHVELKVARRFGQDIAFVANEVREGRLPKLDLKSTVSLIEPVQTGESDTMAASLYMRHPAETIVLCGTRKLATRINLIIQRRTTWHNKPLTVWNRQFDCRQDFGFRLHDQVICSRNHWDEGIQNGSVGRIVGIDAVDSDEVRGSILWDDGEVRPFDLSLLPDLSLAYAITIHKSQGSQWPRVIVVLPEGKMLDRSLVYTAITRAQEKVTLVAYRKTIEEAIKCPKVADRREVALRKWLRELSGSGFLARSTESLKMTA